MPTALGEAALAKPGELVFTRARHAAVMDCAACFTTGSDSDRDRHRCADVEHILLGDSTAALTSKIDDPQLVEAAPKMCSKSSHRFASEVRGSGDECHNPWPGWMLRRLPRSPAPE